MKKIYIIILWMFLGVVYACHKDNPNSIPSVDTNNSPISFSVKDAKDYMSSSTNYASVTTPYSTNSVKVLSTDASIGDRTGTVVWAKARSYKNGKYEVVESPILLSKKIVHYYKLPGMSNSGSDSIVRQAAFSRVAIYRDTATKKISKKIITYIPDRSCVIASGYDVSNNYLNRFDQKFTGFVEFQSWDGGKTSVYRIAGGKLISKYNVALLPKPSNDKQVLGGPNKVKVNSLMCDMIEVEWDEVVSISAETGMAYDNDIIHHDDFFSFCYDDGSGSDPDPGPSPDPTDPGVGGGTTTSPTPPDTTHRTITETFTDVSEETAYSDDDIDYSGSGLAVAALNPLAPTAVKINSTTAPKYRPMDAAPVPNYVKIAYTHTYTIKRDVNTMMIEDIQMDPVTADPMYINYPDGNGYNILRYLSLLGKSATWTPGGVSASLTWTCTVNARYTFSSGALPKTTQWTHSRTIII